MKTVIISDLHLTRHYNKAKADQFFKIFGSADQIIINGDFWDSYFCSFDDFVNSGWSAIFPILKEKNSVYIFGNHDSKEESDERVLLFCNSALDRYEFTSGKKRFFVEHGHLICGAKPTKGFLKKKIKSSLSYFEFPVAKIIGRWVQIFMQYGEYQALKKYVKKNMNEDEYLVCGHIHVPELDESSHYINSGFNRFTWCEWIEIEDGNIELKKL